MGERKKILCVEFLLLCFFFSSSKAKDTRHTAQNATKQSIANGIELQRTEGEERRKDLGFCESQRNAIKFG